MKIFGILQPLVSKLFNCEKGNIAQPASEYTGEVKIYDLTQYMPTVLAEPTDQPQRRRTPGSDAAPPSAA